MWLWIIGSSLSSAIIAYTTFSSAIEVPIVSKYLGGNIFQISSYVSKLTTLYAPWLPKMMAEHAGTCTATLLRVGSVALIVIAGIAILALVCLVLHFYFSIRKRRLARSFGIAGFGLALIVPAVMFAAVWFVGVQMTNGPVHIEVVAVPLGPKLQLAFSALGLVCTLLGTRRSETAVFATSDSTTSKPSTA